MSDSAQTTSWDMRPVGSARPDVLCCFLGRVPYDQARDLQHRLQDGLIQAGKSNDPESPPHFLLLLEHPPVYTLGKSGKVEHLLMPEAELERIGATFHRIGRGGDITYHGPGQLVGYPILDLHHFRTDLTRYVRTLEEVILRTCADFGIAAHRSPAGTGVWTGGEDTESKICAMGIRCSRWVTMHGFAFNVNTDLSYFSHIVPCGIRDRAVTSLANELGGPADEPGVRKSLAGHFADLFGANVQHLEGAAALERLESIALRGT